MLNQLRISVYDEINLVIDYISQELSKIIKKKLLGLYIFGSLADRDFNLNSSDIDLIAIISEPLNDKELAKLEYFHVNIFPYKKWQDRIECSYVPVYLFANILPPYEPRPYFGGGIFYREADYGNEWIINNYLLHKHGIPLIGPNVKTLIKPVSIIDVQRACINDLFQEWEPKISEKEWFDNSHYQAYFVLNLCRILYTVLQRKTASKKVSSDWVKSNFDKKWTKLIKEAQTWSYGKSMLMHQEAIAFAKFSINIVKSTDIYKSFNYKVHHKNKALGIKDIDIFLRKIVSWGMQRDDISAISLVGSYARNQATDESDIDLVILTDNPDQYTSNSDWIRKFGSIKTIDKKEYGKLTSWHVRYENQEVEFGISSSDWATLPIDSGTKKVITDGIIILYDSRSMLRNLLESI